MEEERSSELSLDFEEEKMKDPSIENSRNEEPPIKQTKPLDDRLSSFVKKIQKQKETENLVRKQPGTSTSRLDKFKQQNCLENKKEVKKVEPELKEESFKREVKNGKVLLHNGWALVNGCLPGSDKHKRCSQITLGNVIDVARKDSEELKRDHPAFQHKPVQSLIQLLLCFWTLLKMKKDWWKLKNEKTTSYEAGFLFIDQILDARKPGQIISIIESRSCPVGNLDKDWRPRILKPALALWKAACEWAEEAFSTKPWLPVSLRGRENPMKEEGHGLFLKIAEQTERALSFMRLNEYYPRATPILEEVIIIGDNNAKLLSEYFQRSYCAAPIPANELKYLFNDVIPLTPAPYFTAILCIGSEVIDEGGHPEALKTQLEPLFKKLETFSCTIYILPPPFKPKEVDYWQRIVDNLKKERKEKRGLKYIEIETGGFEALKKELINEEGVITDKGVKEVVQKLKEVDTRLAKQKDVPLIKEESDSEMNEERVENNQRYRRTIYVRRPENPQGGRRPNWRGRGQIRDMSPIRDRRPNIVNRLSFVSMNLALIVGMALLIILPVSETGHPTAHCDELLVPERQMIKDVRLSIYRPNEETQEILGFHCLKRMKIGVTREECLKMIHLEKCFTGTEQSMDGPDSSKRTSNLLHPEFSYFSGGKEATEVIESPLLELEHCRLKDKACLLADQSMLIWNSPTDEQQCNYVKMQKFEGSIITSPKIFTDCGKEMVKTDQLYAITMLEYQKHFVMAKSQLRRSLLATKFSAGETAQRLTNEIQLKKAYNHLAKVMCQQQSELNFLTSLDATMIARQRLADPYVEAKWIGEDKNQVEPQQVLEEEELVDKQFSRGGSVSTCSTSGRKKFKRKDEC